MQKRKILATAGAVTITTLAATAALGTNLGLFGLTTDDANGPGHLAPADPAASTPSRTPAERTEVVDVSVPYYVSDGSIDASETPPAGSPAGGSLGAAAAASSGQAAGGSGRTPSTSATSVTTGPPAATSPAGVEVHATETHETETQRTESTESRVAGAHE